VYDLPLPYRRFVWEKIKKHYDEKNSDDTEDKLRQMKSDLNKKA
jgi:hypothetical protein